MAAAADLEARFRRGFGGKARPHQLEAARGLLDLLRWHPGGGARALVQHAPGAGKTETILLLVYCALQDALVDRAIILNYAVDLEEQLLARATRFWGALGATFSVRRAETGGDLAAALGERGVLLSLLQKFTTCPAQLPRAEATRSLIIIDEAHRGIPEEGTYIYNVDLALGRASKVLFTATPRPDTLRRYGTLRCDAASEGDVLFRAPFHTYTQRDSIRTGATLNPLEKYVSAVCDVEVDGARLSDTATAPLVEFLERLHSQRGTAAVRSALAAHVLQQLPKVDQDMPEMIKQGHQPKKLIVLGDMQEVFEMTLELRGQIERGDLRNAFGRPLKVACFFSGRVTGAKSDKEANSWNFCQPEDDTSVLGEADLIVVCQKYTTGWDEWRVVAVFILRRLGSEELLQQLLGRATRARPGSGKRMPWIFDYFNDPDWVFSGAARFYEECRAYDDENSCGELHDLARQIARFFSSSQRPFQEAAALRLQSCDRALLRAAVVRYMAASTLLGQVEGESPLDLEALNRLLRALNLSMQTQLFGGSAGLAVRAADGAASLVANGGERSRAAGAKAATAGDVPCALRVLRRTLCIGKGVPLETPAKRPRTAARLPGKEQEICDALQLSVDKLAAAFEASLPSLPSASAVAEAVRQRYLTDLAFASARLSSLGASQQRAVEAASRQLRRRLEATSASFLRPWLAEEACRRVAEFRRTAENGGDDFESAVREAKEAFDNDCCAAIGQAGSQAREEVRAGFARQLARAVGARLNEDRMELMRKRDALWAEFEERLDRVRDTLGQPPAGASAFSEEVERATDMFRHSAEALGGRQADCFARSFEDGELQEAIRIFESEGEKALQNNLLQYSAKDHFFRAGILHLAGGDSVTINLAVEKYGSLDPRFATSREGELLAALAEAFESSDVEMFVDKLGDYDAVTKLDPWKTEFLVKVKALIEGPADGEMDLR